MLQLCFVAPTLPNQLTLPCSFLALASHAVADLSARRLSLASTLLARYRLSKTRSRIVYTAALETPHHLSPTHPSCPRPVPSLSHSVNWLCRSHPHSTHPAQLTSAPSSIVHVRARMLHSGVRLRPSHFLATSPLLIHSCRHSLPPAFHPATASVVFFIVSYTLTYLFTCRGAASLLSPVPRLSPASSLSSLGPSPTT